MSACLLILSAAFAGEPAPTPATTEAAQEAVEQVAEVRSLVKSVDPDALRAMIEAHAEETATPVADATAPIPQVGPVPAETAEPVASP